MSRDVFRDQDQCSCLASDSGFGIDTIELRHSPLPGFRRMELLVCRQCTAFGSLRSLMLHLLCVKLLAPKFETLCHVSAR